MYQDILRECDDQQLAAKDSKSTTLIEAKPQSLGPSLDQTKDDSQ